MLNVPLQPDDPILFKAAKAIYSPDRSGIATAAGLRSMLDANGKALVLNQDGAIGAAYLDSNNHVIIAFQGTNLDVHPLTRGHTGVSRALHQLKDDGTISSGKVPQDFASAREFADHVIRLAQARQIPLSDVMATGHSLGGALAEYIASIYNLGGATYGAPAIGRAGVITPWAPSRRLFIDDIEPGDTVGNAGGDTAESLLFPRDQIHYGKLVQAGPAKDGDALRAAIGRIAFLQSALQDNMRYGLDGAVGVADTIKAEENSSFAGGLRYHGKDIYEARLFGER